MTVSQIMEKMISFSKGNIKELFEDFVSFFRDSI